LKKENYWYKTDPKVVNTVKYCMDLGMKEKETVNVLQIMGYNLTERTIRRIKKDLPKPNRLEQLAKKEASFFVIEAIDMLHDLVKKVKKIGDDAKNPFQKIQAYGMIPKMLKDIAEFHDSSPVIAALVKDENNDSPLEKS